jgi:hypothetical protein
MLEDDILDIIEWIAYEFELDFSVYETSVYFFQSFFDEFGDLLESFTVFSFRIGEGYFYDYNSELTKDKIVKTNYVDFLLDIYNYFLKNTSLLLYDTI